MLSKRHGATGYYGVSCSHHLRSRDPPLNSMECGHFLVLGATGAGKSTFGNFLRAQWMQYPHAQASVFDLDGHARLLTYLLGGTWYDLGSPDVRFQPLRSVDDPLRRGLAIQWLLDLLEEYHVPTTAPAQAYVGSHVQKLVPLPAAQRTLSRLVTLMADGSRDTGFCRKVAFSRVWGSVSP
jgi:type IV secretory pathway VirB4 component